ncbi:MAG TPA: tetratricopeptide repeat protein, partial [Planctomycetota bacterium]|nr:tetratricopeptide repeat protein [Planctomycetota bacterium]
TDNDSADLHLSLGEMYESLGYHERSLISYDAAYQLQPGRARPRIALARARLNLGETKLALDEIDALLVGGAGEPEALAVQGVARLRRGQAEEAEGSFRAALEAKPADSEALNGLGVALALQNKPGAAANFVASIKADQYRIDAWLNLAILYLAEGRANEAEALLTAAAQRDPASSTAAAGPGFLALLKGKYEEAGPAFERARKTQPDDYFMAYALGRLKLREGKAQEALDLFRASLKTNPDYLPATTDAALAYLMLAGKEQQQAVGAPPDRQGPFRERAEAHRGNAQTLLETSYRADPNSYAANVALGCVNASRGRAREAGAAFDRAVALAIGRVDPLIDYGRGYVDYWYGANSPKERLDLAALRFDVGSRHPGLTDPADIEWRNECAKALQAIEDWRVQRILIEERFDKNQTSSANAWAQQTSPGGPTISFANDRAMIGNAGGSMALTPYAALEHGGISQLGFLSAEATLDIASLSGFEAGFSLYFGAMKGAPPMANGLHFAFVEDAAAGAAKPIAVFWGTSVAATTKGPSRPANRGGTLPAAPTRIRFKLDRRQSATENNTWIFEFSVWDEAKAAWRQMTTEKNPIKVQRALGDSPTLVLHLWAKTLAVGKPWSMGIDDVRVLGEEK